MVKVLYLLDAIALEPDGLKVEVFLKLLNLFETYMFNAIFCLPL